MGLFSDISAAVFDFDKTVAQTFCLSPNGLGVEGAYDHAVQVVLGEEASIIFRKQGLGNRAPTELAGDILSIGPAAEIIGCARRYLRANVSVLEGLVPTGKGIPLAWQEENPVPVIGEMLTRAKLKLLVDELAEHPDGTIWPEECEGVLEFMHELQKRGIPTAILSSGHELFIRKTFELWGRQAPVMLTDDDLRGLTSVSLHMRMKPHPFLFELLLKKWREVEMWAGEAANRRRFFYFGDDIVKDGELAKSAGLRFGLYDPEGVTNAEMPPDLFRFADWRDLTDDLQTT